ncbi:hypothetical protein Bbelb_434530 [Branchiostoma belcheri]|nr:hypothetical protein Bbelb_434530 [Branchiostoma belcheri]
MKLRFVVVPPLVLIWAVVTSGAAAGDTEGKDTEQPDRDFVGLKYIVENGDKQQSKSAQEEGRSPYRVSLPASFALSVYGGAGSQIKITSRALHDLGELLDEIGARFEVEVVACSKILKEKITLGHFGELLSDYPFRTNNKEEIKPTQSALGGGEWRESTLSM